MTDTEVREKLQGRFPGKWLKSIAIWNRNAEREPYLKWKGGRESWI